MLEMTSTDALAKDCGCTIHDGPHWLHMDWVVKRINMKYMQHLYEALEATLSTPPEGMMIAQMAVTCAHQAVCQAEQRRLREKLDHMERCGIKTISYALLDPLHPERMEAVNEEEQEWGRKFGLLAERLRERIV